MKRSKYSLYIAAIWFINFAVFMGRYSYGTVLKDIAETMVAAGMPAKTASSEAALATTYMFLSYAIGQMLYTLVSKKISPKHTVFGSIIAVTALTLCVPLLPIGISKWLWLANGVFHAVLYVSSMGVLSDFLPKEEMLAAGAAMGSVMPVAQLTLYLLAAVFVKVASWRLVFYVACTLMAIAAGVWYVTYRALEKLPKVTERNDGEAVRIRKPTVPYFVLLATLCICALVCVGAKHLVSDWTTKILESEYGVDPSLGYLLVGILMTVSALTVPLSRLLAKWVPNYCLVNIYQLAVLVGLALVVSFVPLTTWVFYGALVLMAALAFSITNIAASFAPFAYREYMSADVSGGWINAVSCFGASFASLLAGVIMDGGDFHPIFILLAVMAGVCIVPMAVGAVMHNRLKNQE